MYIINDELYKYTAKELNDFEKYKQDLRKRMLIHAIEEYLNELNELCNSETFYAWRDEFENLKGSFQFIKG